MAIALLVVDMQNNLLQNKVQKKNLDHACEYINYVSDLLRTSGHLVVHVQDVEGADVGFPEDYELIPEIHAEPTDITITKQASNAFWQTELEQVLLKHQVELVVVSGFAAEDCVLFTYNGAVERGFNTVMLQNGILSEFPDTITATYRDRNTISYPVVEYLTHLHLQVESIEADGNGIADTDNMDK